MDACWRLGCDDIWLKSWDVHPSQRLEVVIEGQRRPKHIIRWLMVDVRGPTCGSHFPCAPFIGFLHQSYGIWFLSCARKRIATRESRYSTISEKRELNIQEKCATRKERWQNRRSLDLHECSKDRFLFLKEENKLKILTLVQNHEFHDTFKISVAYQFFSILFTRWPLTANSRTTFETWILQPREMALGNENIR
jgi:hypothetical protein